MAFTTTVFLFIVFPVSVTGYYMIRLMERFYEKGAKILEKLFLIGCSLCFYMWASWKGVLFLCAYVAFTWLSGVWIGKSGSGGRNNQTGKSGKRAIFTIVVLILTAVLVYYKYFNFIAENLNQWFHIGIRMSEAAVPLGISFLTFTAISYVTDIYRGNAAAGSVLDAALYLTFFPKVISGPIVLWKDFQVQIDHPKVDETVFLNGLNRIMIGFGKKVIFADNFGAVVNEIQGAGGIDQISAWLCAFFYMLQIYYDFAGYSDIAIGVASLFGFQFKENFHFPYVSQSISEFWRRWHISLGTWFREYIYIPLGGNRRGMYRTLLNLFLVFLLTGIWHGATWNYIFWGILNGICVVTERCIRDKAFYKRIPALIKWGITMFIVLISWEIFRFPDMREFIYFLELMLGRERFETIQYTYVHFLDMRILVLAVIAVLGAVILHFPVFSRLQKWMETTKSGLCIKEFGLFLLMITAVIFMVNSSYSPFLYFQY